MKYEISENHELLFTVNAKSYGEAGVKAAKKLHSKKAIGIRTTGDNDKSGYFQAYLPVPQRLGGGLNSVGNSFHIS